LHYYFSRSMALSSAEARYELAATTTRDYLSGIDNRASQIVRILARHPNLMEQQWVHPATAELFAEVMRSNPVFYAIYIGFGNGDFYELVNLNTSDEDRKSTRLNSSHVKISYAVFCLKKKSSNIPNREEAVPCFVFCD